MKRTMLLCAAMIYGLAAPGAAASLALHYDDTTPFSTTGLTGFSTAGHQMDGMRLIATINGADDLAIWADGAGSCGSAAGTGWSVSECGDTFTSPWSLTSTAPISSLFIDAGAGDTVFDALSGVAGSPGSQNGWPFSILGTNLWDVTATYSGPVGIGGAAPFGDLYRYLRLDFAQPFSGTLSFENDTDNLRISGDLTPVPEPATLVLFGMGLAGAGLRRFRR